MKTFFVLILFVGLAVSRTFAAGPGFRDRLTLFFYKPPLPYDWSTPSRLARSGLRANLAVERDRVTPEQRAGSGPASSNFALHNLGHTNVHLQCRGVPEFWGGMTSLGKGDKHPVLRGAGAEVLWADHPGRLYSRSEIESELPQFFHNERLNMLTYLISHETCLRLSRYVDEYRGRNPAMKFGGLATKARQGRGAGCTEFGVSFLDIAGILEPDQDRDWSRDIWVPRDLIGDLGLGIRPRVSVFAMGFWKVSTRWARPGEKGARHLHFYDPALAHDWVGQVADGLRPAPRGFLGATRETLRPARPVEIEEPDSTVLHVWVDKTSVPTPTDPIWLERPLLP